MNINRLPICLPSRGLVFTKAIEAIENEIEDIPHKFFLSSSLPIPQAHNTVLKRAYDDTNTYMHFLLMEEDVIIPKGGLQKMFDLNSDIAYIDYGVAGWACSTKRSNGETLWCGTGCTLIKRKVLDKLPYPWFLADKVLVMNNWQWINVNPDTQYGMQDIRFGHDVRQLGFTIQQVPDIECDHLQLDTLGEKQINNGCHIISHKPSITNKNIIDPPIGI